MNIFFLEFHLFIQISGLFLLFQFCKFLLSLFIYFLCISNFIYIKIFFGIVLVIVSNTKNFFIIDLFNFRYYLV